MVEILSSDRSTVNGLLHGSTIFRMSPLDNKFHGRFRRSVTLEDSEGFVRPDDLSAGDIPSKAPGTAQSLRFGQIHFAMQQRGFNPPLILNRYLQVIAGMPESFCCSSLCRNHECNKERCNGKQDQTRYLRNTYSEEIMLPGKRVDWGHQVIMESQKSEYDRQQCRPKTAKPCSKNNSAKHRRCDGLSMQ